MKHVDMFIWLGSVHVPLKHSSDTAANIAGLCLMYGASMYRPAHYHVSGMENVLSLSELQDLHFRSKRPINSVIHLFLFQMINLVFRNIDQVIFRSRKTYLPIFSKSEKYPSVLYSNINNSVRSSIQHVAEFARSQRFGFRSFRFG